MAEHTIRQAEEAVRKGEVDSIHCASKNAVLDMIEAGNAHALSVRGSGIMSEFGNEILDHYAVTFHNAELGAEVRQLVLRGFGRQAA